MSTDRDDRLIFGEGPLGTPPDMLDAEADADAAQGRNRAFIYIAVAMAGLVLLGILALVTAIKYWLPAQQARQMAAVTSTVYALTREAVAWTATPDPTATPVPPSPTPTIAPTTTLAPTATSTRVVSQGGQVGQQATKTPTPVQIPGTTPPAGLGVGGMFATAAGLFGLLFVSRKLRGPG